MTAASQKAGFTLNGRTVFIGVALFFGVIIGLDTLFAVLASRTFSGEVARNPYEAGLLYNRTLELRRKQAALGWRVNAALADGSIVLKVRDQTGDTLEGLKVTGVLVRPATETGKQALSFKDAGAGTYSARAGTLSGAWDLQVRLTGPQGQTFDLEHRLVQP